MAAKDNRYAELQRIARRKSQRGYFTNAQALTAGVSSSHLTRLVQRNLVVRCAPRVYRFRVAGPESWKDRLAVKLLTSRGVASGLSSIALYDLCSPPPQPTVIVARSGGRVAAGRHTTRNLPQPECTTVDGLRTLTPIRAILDSAHRVPRTKAVAIVESAIVRGLVDTDALRRRAKELTHSKRPGCAVVLGILAELHPELTRSRNEWEALVARRAKESGLPRPQLEHELFIDGHRYIADAAWPEQRVALEFDGRDPHMRRTVHDYDTLRRNDFTDAGWKRFGITAAALKRRDDRVFRQVARAVARRSERPGLRPSQHVKETKTRAG
jgi:very-short-patch-repair endonuclease